MSNSLLIDLYELTMAQSYFRHKRDTAATFDLFIRSSNRPFYVACGVDEALSFLEDLRFTKEGIDYLRSLKIFEEDFLEYLREFKFKGEVWGLEEPEIVFAQEPILRVTGNIIEAQIVESALLNKVNLATTLATKAFRVVLAAKGRGVYDFALRRTQGQEVSLAVAKYSYIVGAKGTSNCLAGLLYSLPVAGTMAHSFVMSFEREIESFLAFAQQFPAKSILLVDTYDVKQGIASAIRVAKYLKKKGHNLLGIRFDSGDLAGDAKYARRIFDQEGLIDVLIFASGNLDEYAITKLIEKGAPIDAFGVGTHMGCSSDVPYSDVIYKLVEIKEKGKYFIPTMKLSAKKATLPSSKQILRLFDNKGKIVQDQIVLEKEKSKGKKLLRKLMEGGNRLYKEKTIQEKRRIFAEKSESLPQALKKVKTDYNYPVKVSKQLSSLTQAFALRLQKRMLTKVIFLDIDTQYDFLDKNGALYVKNSEKIIPNLKKITNFAKKHGVLIVSSQDTHHKGDPEFKEFGPHCVRGSKGHKKEKATLLDKHKLISFQKVHSLQELKDFATTYPQLILEKPILNVFSNPNTRTLLEVLFPDKIYIYGVVTEYCIKEAVEGILRLGLEVVVIEDAVKEISPKEKAKLFSLWKRQGVKFSKTEAVLKSLCGELKG
ncbi:MAG: nicotinate phosphoribosyltransferase [Candidatus Omnitrophota bacterium]|nr:MAG: nicotinate phosphoribosyltransferase [Candidatus Omnitrophota bacterium]